MTIGGKHSWLDKFLFGKNAFSDKIELGLKGIDCMITLTLDEDY